MCAPRDQRKSKGNKAISSASLDLAEPISERSIRGLMDMEYPLSRVERTRLGKSAHVRFEPVAYLGLDPHLARSGRFSLASPRQSATIYV